MSKVLFLNIPAHGHTNPTLAIVKELVNRGEQVIYYSFPAYKDQIVAVGAEYREYKNFPKKVDSVGLAKSFAFLHYSILIATSYVLDDLVKDIRSLKPDYIIHDSLCLWGHYAAQICKIPAITSISTFAFTPDSTDFKTTLSWLLKLRPVDLKYLYLSERLHSAFYKKYGIEKQEFVSTLVNTSELNLVYTSREFQPCAEKLSPDQYKFIGPSITKRMADADQSDYSALGKPLIYISLGTILNSQDFYSKCFDAFRPFPGKVVLSIGTHGRIADLEDVPENFIIKNHVNQLEILQRADVFITHGGMNSVHEGIYYGVPLCVYPFQVEQESVARRVAETGCGIILKNLTSDGIRRSVDNLINAPEFRGNCQKLGVALQRSGGYQAGVDYIFDFKKTFQP